MPLFVILIALSFAAKQSNNVAGSVGSNEVNVNDGEEIFVKIEEDEYTKKKERSSQFIGVSYNPIKRKWRSQRHSKRAKTVIYNGSYDNEGTAAHASDTLAKKLLANGEQGHKLNFPDDDTEVFQEKKTVSSQFIGVSYDAMNRKWQSRRHSKYEKKIICNGCYDNEEKAARASDTLAKKLLANGEQGHKLNFPDDDTEVFPEEKTVSSQFLGVSYDVYKSKWRAQRHSKLEKKILRNGYYDNEETAALASDTLARKLTANGEQGHKLNFPDDDTEVLPMKRQRKRKRHDHDDLGHPKNN